MASSWAEVEQVRKENRHELVLTGAEVSKRIEENGLDENVYSLASLNFLEISRTSLTGLSPSLGNLVALTNLVIHHNKLSEIPSSIGKLGKLKLLDLSGNELETLPDELGELSELHSLNVSGNQLNEFPDVSTLTQLHILDISHNRLEALPDGISSPKLTVLAQILASGNEIQELPHDLSELPSLKTLDVSNNKITEVPSELSQAPKLKELNCKGNKLKDRRLGKMMEQCLTKAVMDYLRNAYEKEASKGKGSKDKKGKKKKKGKVDEDDIQDLTQNMMQVLHFQPDSGVEIHVKPEVAVVRPYIVCCVLRNLDFSKSKNLYKRFINLQTKLHDGICERRQTATIATHDLKAVKSPLVYEARKPTDIMLRPLFKTKEVSAQRLVLKLRQEAEELRKEKKRNTFSGIHKYLDLLKDKPVYPCLVDKEGVTVSFPPITNCDVTKVSSETTDLLIEVTSSVSLDICKKVMDEMLQQLLEMGVGRTEQSSDGTDDQGAAGGEAGELSAMMLMQNQKLAIEQVRVLDIDGGLKVVYPSRTDLQSAAYVVVRD